MTGKSRGIPAIRAAGIKSESRKPAENAGIPGIFDAALCQERLFHLDEK
jgi:hypothetical protein